VTLIEAIDIRSKELVVVIGGAIASTLARALAREIEAAGRRVVTCATIDVALPQPDPGEQVLADPNPEVVYRDLIERLKYFPRAMVGLGGRGGYVTLRTEDAGRKLRRVPHHLIRAIHGNPSVSCLLVMTGRPADRPSHGSPPADVTIPDGASLVVPIAEIEPGTDDASIDVMGGSLPRPDGLLADSPPDARIVPFLAIGDSSGDRVTGRKLAARCFEQGSIRPERVVLGPADGSGPVEVISSPEENRRNV
jgi:hypothetical protein